MNIPIGSRFKFAGQEMVPSGLQMFQLGLQKKSDSLPNDKFSGL